MAIRVLPLVLPEERAGLVSQAPVNLPHVYTSHSYNFSPRLLDGISVSTLHAIWQ
jgi:hypothetical protein